MPFILCGATLYGINCAYTANAKRTPASWALLAQELPAATLARMTHALGLSAAIAASRDSLDGQLRGRTVVAVNR